MNSRRVHAIVVCVARSVWLLPLVCAAAGVQSSQPATQASQPAAERELLERAVACMPSPRQLAWQKLEFTAFVHFGVNTFTDREWGTGAESPGLFDPAELDAEQWVRTFADAGMRGVILTAKHHDGFCLWPTAYSPHSVRASPWRGGRGDVVRDLADACRRHGLRFGFYLSPADLNAIERGVYGNGSEKRPSSIPTPVDGAPPPRPAFGYTVDDYNRYFLNQLYELLTGYGPVFEVWFDGANPKPGTGQTYDYSAWYDLIRSLAPDAVIAIKGPDVRWVGNEAGESRPAEWSVIPLQSRPDENPWRDRTEADLGSRAKLRGAAALHWYPAEVDVSIRPGWFYHPAEDERVKSLEHLVRIYDASVGNNCVLLLNVPPDRRGLIHEADAARLRELGEHIRRTYEVNLAAGAAVRASAEVSSQPAVQVLDGRRETFWTTPDGVEAAELTLSLPRPATFDRAMLAEHIESGQRIERHALDAWIDGQWREIARAETVGYRKHLRFEPVTTDRVRLRILSARIRPTLGEFSLHREPRP